MRDKPLVLLAEDNDSLRKMLGLVLARSGYGVVEAADGEQAVAESLAHRPDLIVLDIRMPKLNGVEALHRIRSSADLRRTPVIMLSALSQRQDVVESARAGATDYMVKGNFDIKAFLAKIRGLLAGASNGPAPAAQDRNRSQPQEHNGSNAARPASDPAGSPPPSPAPPVFTPDGPVRACQLREAANLPELADHVPPMPAVELDAHARQITELKALPFIMPQIMALTGSQYSSAAELVRVIQQDVALTAKVLAVANSSLYRHERALITDAATAVRNIGFGSVRQAALGLGLVDFFGQRQTGDTLDRLRFWEHSFATATIAKTLAEKIEIDDSLAFVTGLLHNFGRLLQEERCPGELARLAELYGADRALPADLERRWMGSEHAQLSAAVMRQWHIPASICDPIEDSRLPWAELWNLPMPRRRWAVLVRLSGFLATCLDFGDLRFAHLDHLDDEMVDDFGIDDEALANLRDALPDKIRELKVIMLAYMPSVRLAGHKHVVRTEPLIYLRPRRVRLDLFEVFLRLRFRHVQCLSSVEAFIQSVEQQAKAPLRAVINLLPSSAVERAIGQLDGWAKRGGGPLFANDPNAKKVPSPAPCVILARADQAERLAGPLGCAFPGILAPVPVARLTRVLGLLDSGHESAVPGASLSARR